MRRQRLRDILQADEAAPGASRSALRRIKGLNWRMIFTGKSLQLFRFVR
jgi:hypothetical protein